MMALFSPMAGLPGPLLFLSRELGARKRCYEADSPSWRTAFKRLDTWVNWSNGARDEESTDGDGGCSVVEHGM